MKTVRLSVFETNSSSCHTVTIGGSAADTQDGLTLEVRGTGEYGWESGKVYSTPEELMDYAMVAFGYVCQSEEFLKERMEEISECFARHGVTVEWFEYEPGLDHVCWNENHDFGNRICEGYIDHQSAPGSNDECSYVARIVGEDAEALYDFVFGGSTVETGNDNSY